MTPNIEISTVIGCKMQCSYCPQDNHIRNYVGGNKPIKMSDSTFKKCLAKIPYNVHIYFAGMAEPFMNYNTPDWIQICDIRGYELGIYTTCYLLGLKDAIDLSKIKFHQFCIHLPDANGLMKFKVTDEYLQVLQQCMKIPNHNFICIGEVHPEVKKITGPVPDSSPGLFSRAGNLKHLAIQPKKGKLKCSAMSEKMDHNVLLPNGDVLICCQDYSQQHVIGNLLEMDYEDLFKSEEYNKIKQGLEDENSNIICRRCEVATEI